MKISQRQLELLIKEASAPGAHSSLSDAEFDEVLPVLATLTLHEHPLAMVARGLAAAGRAAGQAMVQMGKAAGKMAKNAAKNTAKDLAKEKASDAADSMIGKAQDDIDKENEAMSSEF